MLTGSGTLSSVAVQSNGAQRGILFQIRVDGTQLVDLNAAGNDSLVDSPTSYGTPDTGVGGEVRGNYCTWNPLFTNSAFSISNGNLDLTTSSVYNTICASTFGLSSGKWYWEITINSGAGAGIGVCTSAVNLANFLGGTSASRSYDWTGQKYPGGASYGASYTVGDIIGVAIDVDAGTLVYYKNGVSQGTAFTDLAGSTWFPAIGDQGAGADIVISANFGQRPFAYPLSGFKALCTTNLPEPTIADGSQYFQVIKYPGNGTTQTISGLNFSPDLVWIKSRSDTFNNCITDAVRGTGKELYPNLTNVETTFNIITALNADGFDVSTQSGAYNATNWNNSTYVAWTWDAGSSTVTNTQGSITSQVRANTSAGFSVVTFTDTGSACTVGHGLGVEPYFIIAKFRGAGGNWSIYHKDLGNTKRLRFTTEAVLGPDAGFWNNTSPTSTVFSLGSSLVASTTQVAYCFAPVAGYSSFGSYTGNGSADGPFVYTGHRTRFFLYKRSDTTATWNILDTARDPYNLANTFLVPNSSGAEVSGGSASCFDFLSNGFKIRGSGTATNASGGTYVFASFAESPFNYARAR